MRIFITGATGFVGRMLVAKMAQEGHEVVACTRNIAKAKAILGSRVSFIPSGDSEALREQLGACDAVINLQGENLFGGRWTSKRKRELRESRISFAKELSDCILSLGREAPKVLITASAVGYYGMNVSEPIDESAAAGNDFLAHLCRDWENEALGLSRHGIRVAALRIGVVIGKDGGAMQKLLTPFKMGVGGRLGSGKQYMPWIHLSDLVSLISVALKDDRYQGPINATAPSPTTNEEFTKVLASALNRPAIFPVPSLALRAILGEAASVLLYGQNVYATRLVDLGFHFQFPELRMAIGEVLSEGGVSIEKSSGGEFVLKQEIVVSKPIEEVFEFFSRAENLGAITPRDLDFSIRGKGPSEIQAGIQIDYDIKLGPIPMRWTSSIDDWRPGHGFVDNQIRGPYAKWSHRHDFNANGENTIITDTVSYRLPFGPFGKIAHRLFVRSKLTEIFAFRSYFSTLRFGTTTKNARS